MPCTRTVAVQSSCEAMHSAETARTRGVDFRTVSMSDPRRLCVGSRPSRGLYGDCSWNLASRLAMIVREMFPRSPRRGLFAPCEMLVRGVRRSALGVAANARSSTRVRALAGRARGRRRSEDKQSRAR